VKQIDAPCTPVQDGVEYTDEMLLNTRELVKLGDVRWGTDRDFLDRIQIHFSIGQAF
jgi:hypothetical protein